MECVHRLQVAWMTQEWKKSIEDNSRDGRSCVVKMTIKDKVKDIIYTDRKNAHALPLLELSKAFLTSNIKIWYHQIPGLQPLHYFDKPVADYFTVDN